jgi:hypothetical protein
MTNLSKPFAVAMSQQAQARLNTCFIENKPLGRHYWAGYRDAWQCLAALLDGEAPEDKTFGVVLATLVSMDKVNPKGEAMSRIEEWARERKARELELQVLAEATALHLGKPWEYQKPPHDCGWIGRIVNGKAEIHLRRNVDRVTVRGRYPGDNLPWSTKPLKITVAWHRGADALAKEIRRRFLPTYLVLYGQSQKAQREDEARLKQEDETKAKLLDSLSGTLHRGRAIHFSGPGDSRGTAEVSGGSVRFELRGMSHEDACWLAAILQQHRQIKR